MREPKAMKELHKIREKMSKLSREELLKELEETREKYKDIIATNEAKSKKILVKVWFFVRSSYKAGELFVKNVVKKL